MVVVRRFVRELVAREAVAELSLEGDAALGEELERPVNGGVADARVLLTDLGEQRGKARRHRAVDEGGALCLRGGGEIRSDEESVRAREEVSGGHRPRRARRRRSRPKQNVAAIAV